MTPIAFLIRLIKANALSYTYKDLTILISSYIHFKCNLRFLGLTKWELKD